MVHMIRIRVRSFWNLNETKDRNPFHRVNGEMAVLSSVTVLVRFTYPVWGNPLMPGIVICNLFAMGNR